MFRALGTVRRILCVLLTVPLVFSCLPADSFAATPLPGSHATALNGARLHHLQPHAKLHPPPHTKLHPLPHTRLHPLPRTKLHPQAAHIVLSRTVAKQSLSGIVIALDAGHGGTDLGAHRELYLNHVGACPPASRPILRDAHGLEYFGQLSSPVKTKKCEVEEKDLTLLVVNGLRRKLVALGATVIVDRSGDTTLELSDIVAFTKRVNPQLFIAIHMNANNNETVDGIETYYYYQNSRALAGAIFHKMVGELRVTGTDWMHQNDFYVVDHPTGVPSTLVECGYLSNYRKMLLLIQTGYRQRIINAIADGVTVYVSSSHIRPRNHPSFVFQSAKH